MGGTKWTYCVSQLLIIQAWNWRFCECPLRTSDRDRVRGSEAGSRLGEHAFFCICLFGNSYELVGPMLGGGFGMSCLLARDLFQRPMEACDNSFGLSVGTTRVFVWLGC